MNKAQNYRIFVSNEKIMPITVNYEDVLNAAKNLTSSDLQRLLDELNKDVQKSKLDEILESFKTDELSEEDIVAVCKNVRSEIYAERNGTY